MSQDVSYYTPITYPTHTVRRGVCGRCLHTVPTSTLTFPNYGGVCTDKRACSVRIMRKGAK